MTRERGHSALVECRGGCKPRPLVKATVRASWWRRLLSRLVRRRAVVRCSRCGEVRDGQPLPRGTTRVCTGTIDFPVGDEVYAMCMTVGVRRG